jgi:hypothetical protein
VLARLVCWLVLLSCVIGEGISQGLLGEEASPAFLLVRAGWSWRPQLAFFYSV